MVEVGQQVLGVLNAHRKPNQPGANPAPLALYGALSLALLMLGLATGGIGLLLALPWSAAASYAAWKDVFGVA